MNLKEKIVSVFGMGRSGISSLKLLKEKETKKIFAINSGEPSSWAEKEKIFSIVPSENCFAEEDSHEIFLNSDLIILSPGIAREHPALKKAMKKNIPVINEIELAYKFLPPWIPTIAVTGTNGKTTTVSLMNEMIKLSGYDVFMGGNIGIALCELVLEKRKVDFILLELSSFQLESLPSFHPHVAIILNVYPNHGERYENIEDYAKAKFHIADLMTENDFLFYPEDMPIISSWAKTTKAQLTPLRLDKDFATRELQKNYDLSHMKIPGAHNLFNTLFASKAIEKVLKNKEGIQKAISSFAGVKYRVQYIETKKNFIVYNDAKSTNWSATKVAIESIDKKDRRLCLIIGGQRRGRNDSILPYIDEFKKRVDRIFLIGETAEELSKELEGKIPHILAGNLENVFEVMEKENAHEILLLSPAFPSYDQYANYEKRGEHFTKLASRA